MYTTIGVYIQPQLGIFLSKINQDVYKIRIHDGIAVATTKKHLPQTLTEFFGKSLRNSFSSQVVQWHVRINAHSKIVARALRARRIAIGGNF
jgi:hypothetical protein